MGEEAGDWLTTFALLTECTDAKFCNTTNQVLPVITNMKLRENCLVPLLLIKKEFHTSYHCLPSASLCVRKLSHHQFDANVEFATRVTRLDRVNFFGAGDF